MHLHSAVALALLGSSASALSAQSKKIKNFSLSQVASKAKVFNPAAQVLRTHEKYGVSAPPSNLKLAAAKNAKQAKKNRKTGKTTASITANSYMQDMEYLIPVTIAGTNFDLNLDTGSADLWVFSVYQKSSQTAGHSVYNPSSSGQLQQGSTWAIQYGDNSGASGIVFADTVTIGPMTATSQTVEAATSVSSQFVGDDVSDGLIGLAFSSINTVQPRQARNFFDTVAPSLSQKLFTVALKKNAPGTYDFGYINQTRYQGPIVYTPVSGNSGFWALNTLSGFQVQGQGQVSSNIGMAIVDTGTTLMYLPNQVVKAYYSKVMGAQNSDQQGGWIFPCASYMPDLRLRIAGTYFTIAGRFLNQASIDNYGIMCFGGLQSSANLGLNILGDVFLKGVFVVFDQTQSAPRLGFAQQR